MPNLLPLKVILIGSGNVATHLGRALKKNGADILQVYSREISHARALAKKLGAKAVAEISAVREDADLYVIAVKDDVLPQLAKSLKVQHGIVAHTAGSVSIDALKMFRQRGVLYPLQSLSQKREIDFSQVPLCIEAGDKSTLGSLKEVAAALSSKVYQLDSGQRAAAHLAAVFANNFTNHLYRLAGDLLEEHRLPFDLIRPLIAETAEKVQQLSPADAQTGPALRNDRTVMKKHLGLLEDHADVRKIYRKLSKSICQKNTSKK